MGLPVRATADIDLGVDRTGLRLSADRSRIRPLLEAHDFRVAPGDEEFRFSKSLGPDGTRAMVDVVMPKGQSKADPPLLERGVPTVAAPGLAYALARGGVEVDVEFVTDGVSAAFRLPLPRLDAAFVLKAALVSSGVRQKRHHLIRDTVDAVMLAAACAADDQAVASLRDGMNTSGPGRREARGAVRWLSDAMESPRSAAARRLDEHFHRSGVAEWGVQVAAGLRAGVQER